jgi:heme-degrading monooxygenase HmoA
MHARMSTLEGPPDRMDEGLRHVREQVLPLLRQQDGFKGFVALGDRQSGKLIGVSFWENEQAMQASEEVGNRTRSESAEAMGDTVAGVERYEVSVFEAPSTGPVSGVTDTVGDTVGGVTGTVGGSTDSVRGVTDNLLGGEEKQR